MTFIIESSVPSIVEGRQYYHNHMWYVYIVQNAKRGLYVGVSKNPERRLKEHNTQRGSVFTKSGNFEIVFKEEYLTFIEARQREIQIKKWRREKKENLVRRYRQGFSTKI